MYTVFTKEDIEAKLSKRFCQKVVVDLKDGSDVVMVKFEDCPYEKKDIDSIVHSITSNDGSVGLVDTGVLMVFPNAEEMETYRERN